MNRYMRKILIGTAFGRLVMVPVRFIFAVNSSGLFDTVYKILTWTIRSKERVNITYETTKENIALLCESVSHVVGRDKLFVKSCSDEIINNRYISDYYRKIMGGREFRYSSDSDFMIGKRLCYYLFTRACAPRVVVEAGVDKGLGALVINEALSKNSELNLHGKYVGIEINKDKRLDLFELFPDKMGEVIISDVIKFLDGVPDGSIDIFIHDTIPDPDHVARIMKSLQRKMAFGGIFISVWSTEQLIHMAAQQGLDFFQHVDSPVNHWHLGSKLLFIKYPSAPNEMLPHTSS